MKLDLPDISALRAGHLDQTSDGSTDGAAPYYNHHQLWPDASDARDKVWAGMKTLVDTAKTEGRNLTAAEQRHYDKAELLLDELSTIMRDTEVFDGSGTSISRLRRDGGPSIYGAGSSGSSGEYREGRPLTSGQSCEGYARSRGLLREDEDRLDLRKYLRGIATGDWQGADAERRAMSEGTAAAGGFLLPTLLSAQIIDLVRNQTQVMAAGATVVPMENRTMDLPKWTGDPSAAWHTENAAITPSDATLGKVTLTAQALAATVLISWELLEDAPGVEAKLQEAFAKVFALRLDLAALYGSGTAPEPRGIKNTTGITTASLGANGATPTSYDFLIDAAGRLADNNESPTGIIFSGRTARSLSKLKDTTNQPLGLPDYVSGLPRYATNQIGNAYTVGTSADTSDVFVADWRQLLIGVRTQLQIKVLDQRYADYGQTGFVAWWRGDVAVARPKAFDVTTGVRP